MVRFRGRRSAGANFTPMDCNRSGLTVMTLSCCAAVCSARLSASPADFPLDAVWPAWGGTVGVGCGGATGDGCRRDESHSRALVLDHMNTASEAATPMTTPRNTYCSRDVMVCLRRGSLLAVGSCAPPHSSSVIASPLGYQ